MLAEFSAVQDRLDGVVIEHLDFERLIRIYDRPDALFYCDPPYYGAEKYYRAAFTEQDHQRLAECLHSIKGKFLLSYNDCPQARARYPRLRDHTLGSEQQPICKTIQLPRNPRAELFITNSVRF